jgi:hypothetical protein
MSGNASAAHEALESPTRLVTDVATQWLASMDEMRDEDAAERPKDPVVSPDDSSISPGVHASPVLKKHGRKEDSEDTEGATQEEAPKKRPKRKYRKSTINVRKVGS